MKEGKGRAERAIGLGNREEKGWVGGEVEGKERKREG